MSTLSLLVLLAQVGAAAPPAVPDAPSRADTPNQQAEADALMRQATEAYNRDDLPAALVALERGYKIWPRIDILFNVAQVQYALHDCAAALASYRRFLAEAGADDHDRPRATRRAGEMRTCIEHAPRGPPPAKDPEPAKTIPATPAGGDPAARLAKTIERSRGGAFLIKSTPTEQRHPRLRIAAWGLLAAAVLAAGASVYLAWRASADSDFSNVIFGTQQYQAQSANFAREQRWAPWLGVGALAAGVGGAALMVVSRPDPPSSAGLRASWGLGWAWRF